MFPWLSEPAVPGADAPDATPLAKRVRDDLLDAILSGRLAAGQRINEPDVAQRLGVSRVPVREALRELESSGLVVARKHAGVFVRQPQPDEVADLYEFRALLERFAGTRVAGDPAPALLSALADSVDAMAQAARSHDVQRYYVENLRFHWRLIDAAGNAEVADAYQRVVQRLHLARLTNLAQTEGMQTSVAEHQAIVAAIRQRDPQRCADLMASHVGRAHERLRTGARRRS